MSLLFPNKETKGSGSMAKKLLLFVVILVSFFLVSCKGGKNMKISSVFRDGEFIPEKYTCNGKNINPPLTVTNIPTGAKTIAVIMDDPDAPGKTFVHWVLWNLDVNGDEVKIDEGLSRDASCCEQGLNDFGNIGYDGPCPPQGHGVHHYHIKVYALDTKLNLPPKATKKDLEDAMKGHILSHVELMGLFERK